MSFDIHVMPLWKYWAGEYTTAAERFAERMGVPMSRIGQQPKALYDLETARQLGKGTRIWMEQATGMEDAWEDDGDIVFSEQFQFEAIHAVRAYSAHLESSDEPFDLTADFHLSPALRRITAGVPTEFPHLIHHEDNGGFYVPLPFPHPKKLMGSPPWVGSSIQLMIELATLKRSLSPFPDYEALRDGAEMGEAHAGLAWVKHGIAFLYHASWTSAQSRMPIIFDG